MSRSDDPSSRSVGKTSPSRPGVKPVPASEGKLRAPAKRKPESKSDLRAAGAEAQKPEAREEREHTVVHRYDSDFGVAMMIRGNEES